MNAELGDFSLNGFKDFRIPSKIMINKKMWKWVITTVKQLPKSMDVFMNGGPSTFKPLSKQSILLIQKK